MSGYPGDHPEPKSLEERLAAQRAANEELQLRIQATLAEKQIADDACLAGIEAARKQMERLRAELKFLQSFQDKFDEAYPTRTISSPKTESEEERQRRQTLQTQARTLRSDLSKWRHQVEMLEAERPQQEQEIDSLKTELSHSKDILETTRHASRHLEVERAWHEGTYDASTADAKGAGIGGVEARAEKRAREMAEERSVELSAKVKRLSSVLLAQQMLIQRLQKTISKEEAILEKFEFQLSGEAKQNQRLKGALRQRSDDIVVSTLFGKLISQKVSSEKPVRSSSVPSGLCSEGTETARTASMATSLPQITDKK